ncbi:RDD family protein [Streptomyces sp. NPDC052236]|uniref:RDD family protein n=1 Tax=Streptomyces sp. NPDC052236 TaxID=3365686 RepID=UPI0037CD40BD
MSAPTPATGDGSPTPGFYPDPSIPGYVRYWNGGAWVPGTSRPGPEMGQPLPRNPGSAAMEETGPVFFDEEVSDEPSRPEPATAWQADVSRQEGWASGGGSGVGSGQDPRTPNRPDQSGGPGTPPADPRAADPTGGALPGVRSQGPAAQTGEPPVDGTVTIRAVRPGAGPGAGPGASELPAQARPRPLPRPQPPAEGTVSIRALRHGGGAPTPVTPPAQPQTQQPQPHVPAQAQPQAQPQAPAPVTNGSGGGSASWAQQAHSLGGSAESARAVLPWKPPVTDPFMAAAQVQAAARPASLGKRLAARLIDTLLLGALVGAAAVPVVTRARAHIDDKIEAAKLSGETVTVWLVDSTTAVHLAIIVGALLLIGTLYEALPTARWGRTLGKKLCGLTVWGIESHEPPSFGAALRRWLVYGVLGILAVGVLNVLWCLFDRPWRQCWHDKAARTFVTG